MKRAIYPALTALIFLVGLNAFSQNRDITIIGGDEGDEDFDFLAWAPEVPMPPEFGGMGMGFGMGPGGIMIGDDIDLPDPGNMPDDLNLTKDQMDKIKKIRSNAKKANIPLHSDVQLKHLELKDLMDSDSPDKAAVAGKIKEIDALRTQIKLNHMNARIDCRNVLTKEQKEKLEQLRERKRMMFMDGGKRKMKFKRWMHGE